MMAIPDEFEITVKVKRMLHRDEDGNISGTVKFWMSHADVIVEGKVIGEIKGGLDTSVWFVYGDDPVNTFSVSGPDLWGAFIAAIGAEE